MSQFTFAVTSPEGFDATVARVTEALKDEGFGVLTTIDVAATLKAKLGLERSPYIILGACNPQFAHQALEAEPDIGALLPCNVVVREEAEGKVGVLFMDPAAVLGLVANADVDRLGKEVAIKLRRVAETLSA
ncbi:MULTISPECIES: DUF302 domain-containing protein [unclassified Thioclava]|uniref:DUF302 domain-containing protein n=1 Tax=unclassified Thioclava TaxID=2621713 RepID=UPI000998D36D|nr:MULTISPECIES: DUF302 domain-containing protein [unclassified Thioclava]OOY05402.1 hypothetical protein BMI87_04910 [Thioclava sp. F28-4]OOY07595.1 hypothetical protein BMI89_16000 [Thioclava sp. F36-7]OWX97995.1 hypothetical protein B6V76_19120 [Thioclava sp. IC9]OWY11613.1 hypothetical protein B6V73_19095 [Thioclava sp. JM3]